MASGDRYKFGAEEINGVDQEFPCDIPLDAENVFYDNSSSGLTAVEVQAAIDELADDEDVDFESFTDTTEYATTSNNFITIFDRNYNNIQGGTYLLLVTYAYTNSDKEKRVGHRVILDNTPLDDVRNTVGFDNAFSSTTFHRIVPASTGVRLRLQHGETDDGGTARTKDITITLIRVQV